LRALELLSVIVSACRVVLREEYVAIPSYRRGVEKRLGLAGLTTGLVPIRIDGETVRGGKIYLLSTTTTVLSEFGCLIDMEEEVTVDQTIVLMNEHTRQSAQ